MGRKLSEGSRRAALAENEFWCILSSRNASGTKQLVIFVTFDLAYTQRTAVVTTRTAGQ